MNYKRICNLAILITSVFVFIAWSIINTINIQDPTIKQITVPAISFIFAYGFFSFVVSFFILLLKKFTFIKKIILAGSFIEGVWIGYYVRPDSKVVCFYQVIEQNIDHINIVTQAYDENGTRHRGSWRSSSDVFIDSIKSSLSYIYEVELVDEKTQTRGVFTSTFFKKGFLKNPFEIRGFAFNNVMSERSKVVQKKKSNNTVVIDKNKLLKEAFDFYNKDNTITEDESS